MALLNKNGLTRRRKIGKLLDAKISEEKIDKMVIKEVLLKIKRDAGSSSKPNTIEGEEKVGPLSLFVFFILSLTDSAR